MRALVLILTCLTIACSTPSQSAPPAPAPAHFAITSANLDTNNGLQDVRTGGRFDTN